MSGKHGHNGIWKCRLIETTADILPVKITLGVWGDVMWSSKCCRLMLFNYLLITQQLVPTSPTSAKALIIYRLITLRCGEALSDNGRCLWNCSIKPHCSPMWYKWRHSDVDSLLVQLCSFPSSLQNVSLIMVEARKFHAYFAFPTHKLWGKTHSLCDVTGGSVFVLPPRIAFVLQTFEK